jgi:hypothetical protein
MIHRLRDSYLLRAPFRRVVEVIRSRGGKRRLQENHREKFRQLIEPKMINKRSCTCQTRSPRLEKREKKLQGWKPRGLGVGNRAARVRSPAYHVAPGTEEAAAEEIARDGDRLAAEGAAGPGSRLRQPTAARETDSALAAAVFRTRSRCWCVYADHRDRTQPTRPVDWSAGRSSPNGPK